MHVPVWRSLVRPADLRDGDALENLMIRLAVFDCDGTLVDSQANICVACERAFETAGLVPPPRAAIRRIVGLSLVEAMQILVPQGDEALHAQASLLRTRAKALAEEARRIEKQAPLEINPRRGAKK